MNEKEIISGDVIYMEMITSDGRIFRLECSDQTSKKYILEEETSPDVWEMVNKGASIDLRIYGATVHVPSEVKHV